MLPEPDAITGVPVIRHWLGNVLDEIAVVALAVRPNLVKFGWPVTNGQGRELIHYVRMYRELLLVEKINAPCW